MAILEKIERQPDRDLLRFVERFAMMLTDAGLPRMAARVFAYVLAEDSDRYTAAELADGLEVSRAAISGAVRLLVQSGLLGREREPGARVDHYRVYDDDVWSAIDRQRMALLPRWEQAIAEGVRLVGPRTRGGRRLLETLAYFRYLEREFPKLIEDWHRARDDMVRAIVEEEYPEDTG